MIRPISLAEDLVTVDEFYALVGDGQKADLIDGVIYMASPDTRRNNTLNMFLISLLRNFTDACDLGGMVVGSRFAFELTETRAPEPDVAYIRGSRLHLVENRAMKGGPDIAVEIVSRDSRNRDYVEKKQLYFEAGVAEYWLIDPLSRRVEFLRYSPSGYEIIPLENNRIFRSEVIAGFWLDVEWLFDESLARDYKCLQQLLESRTR